MPTHSQCGSPCTPFHAPRCARPCRPSVSATPRCALVPSQVRCARVDLASALGLTMCPSPGDDDHFLAPKLLRLAPLGPETEDQVSVCAPGHCAVTTSSASRASTSSLRGRLGMAPMLCTHRPAAALAKRSASCAGNPSRTATVYVAVKQSPAPGQRGGVCLHA